uniref:Uncharacterized protein n=1 Tax=Setaria italica TaxID=4555 RepID=K3ZYQ1_SETIT
MTTTENRGTQRRHVAKNEPAILPRQPQQYGPHLSELLPCSSTLASSIYFCEPQKCSVKIKVPNPPPHIYTRKRI